jgi:3-deoxy-D-manno-octulosonate 8-phosphate phosphatase (KDO 8-P phosphatase)
LHDEKKFPQKTSLPVRSLLPLNAKQLFMEHIDIEDAFTEIGGQFIHSAFDLSEKLRTIKAFVYDWDGVFNDGKKGETLASGFSEVDSMGTNMLRFGYYLTHGTLPKTAILSGADNPTAAFMAKREHFDTVYLKAIDKEKALLRFCDTHNITPGEVCFFYDDILDLAVAKKVGLRFAVGRLCNPIFLNFVSHKGYADYISACQGNEHAVREFSELLLCLMGKETEVIEERSNFSEKYTAYLELRNAAETEMMNINANNKIGIGYKAQQ